MTCLIRDGQQAPREAAVSAEINPESALRNDLRRLIDDLQRARESASPDLADLLLLCKRVQKGCANGSEEVLRADSTAVNREGYSTAVDKRLLGISLAELTRSIEVMIDAGADGMIVRVRGASTNSVAIAGGADASQTFFREDAAVAAVLREAGNLVERLAKA